MAQGATHLPPHGPALLGGRGHRSQQDPAALGPPRGRKALRCEIALAQQPHEASSRPPWDLGAREGSRPQRLGPVGGHGMLVVVPREQGRPWLLQARLAPVCWLLAGPPFPHLQTGGGGGWGSAGRREPPRPDGPGPGPQLCGASLSLGLALNFRVGRDPETAGQRPMHRGRPGRPGSCGS